LKKCFSSRLRIASQVTHMYVVKLQCSDRGIRRIWAEETRNSVRSVSGRLQFVRVNGRGALMYCRLTRAELRATTRRSITPSRRLSSASTSSQQQLKQSQAGFLSPQPQRSILIPATRLWDVSCTLFNDCIRTIRTLGAGRTGQWVLFCWLIPATKDDKSAK